MPYLTDKRKKEIDSDPKCELVSTGDLTYVLFQHGRKKPMLQSIYETIDRFLPQEPRYADYSAVIGSLFCTAMELKRRGLVTHGVEIECFAYDWYHDVVALYEDKKIKEKRGCVLSTPITEKGDGLPDINIMGMPVDVLSEAHKLIRGERQGFYGPPTENIARIAGMWSAYLGFDITVNDVCCLMILLKAARIRSGKSYHRDSAVDMAGYSGVLEMLNEPEVK